MGTGRAGRAVPSWEGDGVPDRVDEGRGGDPAGILVRVRIRPSARPTRGDKSQLGYEMGNTLTYVTCEVTVTLTS
ncbi:hypothetical protein GCM10022236_08580 [Microlunatus ginsengisoli]|uniref:Kinesin motor domain-containing protein n=1 Tax=Microlunatus ginsengisoli TaxID=363863 RepID=A0ABP6ZHT5_9ACTN